MNASGSSGRNCPAKITQNKPTLPFCHYDGDWSHVRIKREGAVMMDIRFSCGNGSTKVYLQADASKVGVFGTSGR